MLIIYLLALIGGLSIAYLGTGAVWLLCWAAENSNIKVELESLTFWEKWATLLIWPFVVFDALDV